MITPNIVESGSVAQDSATSSTIVEGEQEEIAQAKAESSLRNQEEIPNGRRGNNIMASDTDYAAFLERANAPTGGTNEARAQGSKKGFTANSVNTAEPVPQVLLQVESVFVSETDEEFAPVSLALEGKGVKGGKIGAGEYDHFHFESCWVCILLSYTRREISSLCANEVWVLERGLAEEKQSMSDAPRPCFTSLCCITHSLYHLVLPLLSRIPSSFASLTLQIQHIVLSKARLTNPRTSLFPQKHSTTSSHPSTNLHSPVTPSIPSPPTPLILDTNTPTSSPR